MELLSSEFVSRASPSYAKGGAGREIISSELLYIHHKGSVEDDARWLKQGIVRKMHAWDAEMYLCRRIPVRTARSNCKCVGAAQVRRVSCDLCAC